ncbi:DUF6950 family protein [Variovorax sp. R-27]|uniref:DUF6950 family protein n=1 Tax=Variovorax sp. R-27 TaxID=3404058 RepID=UPI003CEFFDA9
MRLKDWQQRFSDFGKARASMPFAWGSNDCCTFAADAVHAITGRDLRKEFPAYEGALGAARAVEEGGGLQQLTTSLLGEPVSPKLAAVGDVVLVMNAGREMLGICNGTSIAAPGEHGVVMLNMETAIAAWSV